jgi:hypothetical protein
VLDLASTLSKGLLLLATLLLIVGVAAGALHPSDPLLHQAVPRALLPLVPVVAGLGNLGWGLVDGLMKRKIEGPASFLFSQTLQGWRAVLFGLASMSFGLLMMLFGFALMGSFWGA